MADDLGKRGDMTADAPLEHETPLFDTFVAGTTHITGIEELASSLNVGDKLDLFHEPQNEHDKWAIVIKTVQGVKIGYVPRRDNATVFRMLSYGKKVFARISAKEWRENWLKISINIYLLEYGKATLRPEQRQGMSEEWGDNQPHFLLEGVMREDDEQEHGKATLRPEQRQGAAEEWVDNQHHNLPAGVTFAVPVSRLQENSNMAILGKREKIADLRGIWPHEVRDFSAWLARDENIALLRETLGMDMSLRLDVDMSLRLGMDMSLRERESSGGATSVDLYAEEEGTGRKIIIIAQLEDTDFDHLGKIITLASDTNAEIIVWIAKRARNAHRQAIAWLNRWYANEIYSFFLLELELWKINESSLMPKFNIVEHPDGWTNVPNNVVEKIQLSFWESFKSYVDNRQEGCIVFSMQKPTPNYTYNLRVMIGDVPIVFRIYPTRKYRHTAIFIPSYKKRYDYFIINREEIENELDAILIWEDRIFEDRDDYILIRLKLDLLSNKIDWNESFNWMYKALLKITAVIQQYGGMRQ